MGVTEEHVLLFLASARGRWKTATVEGTLAAIKWWHKDKGLLSPTDSMDVRKCMHSLARHHAGTTLGRSVPKHALPAAVVAFLATWVGQLADEALAAGDILTATGRSRDALYIALAFAGCLRKSEAASLRRQDVWFDSPASITVHVTRSKTDQHAVGVSVPISSCTASGVPVGESLRRHMELLDRVGVPPDGPLLGTYKNPSTWLGKKQTPEARTTPSAPCRDGAALSRRLQLYIKALREMGTLTCIDERRIAGHSLRRGGINSIRDAARLRGMDETQLAVQLKAFGRWKSDKSLHTYLYENRSYLLHLTLNM